MKYTREWLSKLGACESAKVWAADHIKEGTVITADLLVDLPNPHWAWWLACQLDGGDVLVWEAANIAFREAAAMNPALLRFVGTVTADNWQEASGAAYDAWGVSDYFSPASAAAHAAYAAANAAAHADHAIDNDDPRASAATAAAQAYYVAANASVAAYHNGDRDKTIKKEIEGIAIRWLVENGFIQGE